MQLEWLSLGALNLPPETQTHHTQALIVKKDEKSTSLPVAGWRPPEDRGSRTPQAGAGGLVAADPLLPSMLCIESWRVTHLISSKLISQNTKPLAELHSLFILVMETTI